MNAMNRPESIEVPAQFRRLFRAFISPQQSRGVEITAFVEASSRETAVRKMCQAVSAMEFGSTPDSVRERIYNCSGAAELIAEGLSEDLEARFFETGWSGGKPICFVENPLVLLVEPGPLLRAWARVGVEP